jgi:two-component system response regulator AtoC
LEQYGWPGNVRELRNVIERAMLLVEHDWLTPNDFSALPRGTHAATFALPHDGLNLEDVERDLLLQALDRTDWNQTQAGRLLGINRDQVRYRIEKFGLPPAAQQRGAAGIKE